MSVYDQPSDPAKRISAALTDGVDRAGARAMLKAVGFTDEDLAQAARRRRDDAGSRRCRATSTSASSREQVKEGIRAAGGTPIEFNTISVSDGVTMGTDGHARVAGLARGDRRLDRARRARPPASTASSASSAATRRSRPP